MTAMRGADQDHLRAALSLAARGLGRVAPNPAVGCILVKDGIVVGRGWTQPGGRPHAETEALARAGSAARGATAYITLEPCAHHGWTPPCADALIAAGITRCVVSIPDPDPRVSGGGIARLRAAGIAVDVGLLGEAATFLNAGFLKRVATGRPLVTLKLATSLDGQIATGGGDSRWITGTEARRAGHMLRREHDAVLVGSGTALADDPQLTVRLAGLEAPPLLRIVVDRRLRTPLTSALVRDAARIPTLIITRPDVPPAELDPYLSCGVELTEIVLDASGAIDLEAMLVYLGFRGLTRILVEGGAQIAAALLRDRLVDRIAWFRSASVIGGDGLAAVQGFGVERLAQQAQGMRLSVMRLGQDLLETIALAP